MEKNKKSITTLFKKYLEGKHSEAELNELLHYFELEEDSDFLRKLIQWQLDQQRFSETENHRIDRLVDSVEHRLFEKVRRSRIARNRIVWRRRAGIAASLLLFVSIGLGLYFYPSLREPGPPHATASSEDALPGGNRATLALTDGSIISLSEDRSGIVTTPTGFTYEDGTLVRDLAELYTGAPVVQYARITTPNGGTYQITLPDGSNVWLNAASTIKYPTVFDGSGERKVELTGEAYFEVAHNPSKPFKVEVNGTAVEVLGTKFNVHAYAEQATTTLIEGSVKVRNGDQEYKLVPGEQSYFDGEHFVVQQADIAKVIAWKDGKFYFKKDNMAEIMDQLARWYDLDVEYHGDLSVSTGYSGHISRYVNLSEVLEMLTFVSPADFVVANQKIHVFFRKK